VIFISFVGSWMYGMGNDSSCLMLEMQGGVSLNNFSVLVWFSFFYGFLFSLFFMLFLEFFLWVLAGWIFAFRREWSEVGSVFFI